MWSLILILFLIVGYLATLSDPPLDESEKFVNIQKYLSNVEMAADIDTLRATFEKIHPNPYRFNSKNQFVARLDSLKGDLPDSLTTIQFWRVIDQIICSYTDAHSYADDKYVLTDYVQKDGLFFPFSAKINDGKILVSDNSPLEQHLPVGTEIQKINGRNANEIIVELASHSSKETHQLDILQVSDDFGFYLWKAFDWDSDFKIHYISKNESNSLDSITVNGISWEDRKSRVKAYVPSLSFNFLKNQIGYMKITDFDGGQKEINEFYDDAFHQLKERGSNLLILDFRGHSGGRDSYGEDLAKYFASKPFRKLSKAYWKITPEFKEAFDRRFIPKGIRWFKPIYLINEYSKVFYGADPMEMVTIDYAFQDPLPMENRFQGEVFLITDHTTFSAGSIFAEMFKHFNMGTIVGQPTGNLYSFNGFALANFTLPNSKLTYQVSSVYNLANSKEEGQKSVEPDFFIDPAKDPVSVILKELIY